MRKLAALSFLVVLICSGSLAARADDAATIAAINASSNELDETFTKKDVETISADDAGPHHGDAYYDDGPQSVEDQLNSLGEYDWSQTIVGDVDVSLLGPEVAMRTFKAGGQAAARARVQHRNPRQARREMGRAILSGRDAQSVTRAFSTPRSPFRL